MFGTYHLASLICNGNGTELDRQHLHWHNQSL
jgi:hypothetical protein